MTKIISSVEVDVKLSWTVRLWIRHSEGQDPLDLLTSDNYSPESYEAKNELLWTVEHGFIYGNGNSVTGTGFEIVGVRKLD